MNWSDFFQHLPELETKRLILRPPRDEDFDAIREYACDDAVTRHLSWPTHGPPEDTRRFLAQANEWRVNGTAGVWGIILREAGRMIGSCGVHDPHPQHLRAELGYVIGRPYWGRGIMVEALGAMFDCIFRATNLNRIFAHCHVDNRGSARVMEKIGMRFEGTARQACFIKGSWWDIHQYAILREDWAQPTNGGMPGKKLA